MLSPSYPVPVAMAMRRFSPRSPPGCQAAVSQWGESVSVWVNIPFSSDCSEWFEEWLKAAGTSWLQWSQVLCLLEGNLKIWNNLLHLISKESSWEVKWDSKHLSTQLTEFPTLSRNLIENCFQQSVTVLKWNSPCKHWILWILCLCFTFIMLPLYLQW